MIPNIHLYLLMKMMISLTILTKEKAAAMV